MNNIVKTTYVDWTEINSLAVAQKGQWAVYIANHLNNDDKDIHVWKYVCNKLQGKLEVGDLFAIIHGGLFFFESEKEMNQFFEIFCQPPVESSAIYACSYDPNGIPLSENT